MKEKVSLIMVVLLLGLLIWWLPGCSNPVSSSPDIEEPDINKPEPFSFDGHWNTYNYLGNQQYDVYFGTSEYASEYMEGYQCWILRNDKMIDGGEFIFDDNTFTTRPGGNFESTYYYTVIDNDTIYIDDIINRANSLFFREMTLKRSGRTGRMLPVDRSWTFVDD